MQVWILTEEFNAYDQYGKYFREVYSDKPNVKQIEVATGENRKFCEWLLESGGGRENPWEKFPDSWYYLRQVDCK